MTFEESFCEKCPDRETSICKLPNQGIPDYSKVDTTSVQGFEWMGMLGGLYLFAAYMSSQAAVEEIGAMTDPGVFVEVQACVEQHQQGNQPT